MPEIIKCRPLQVSFSGNDTNVIFHCPKCNAAITCRERPDDSYCLCLSCNAVFINQKILSEDEINLIFPNADF